MAEMPLNVSGRAAIAGIGQSQFGKNLMRSELELACDAVMAACQDAGLAVEDVDGLASYHVEQVSELDLMYSLGFRNLSFFAMTPSGGGGAASIVGLAAMAVATGNADYVMAFRARNRSRSAAYGAGRNQGGRPWAKESGQLSDSRQWHHPFGVASPAQEMALIARRHMHLFGTKEEHFGMQAVVQRQNASRNPAAIMKEPITLDEWRQTRIIADPIRLVDCSLENDGAVAILVTTAERARDLRQPLVYIAGAVQGGGPIHTHLADWFEYTSSYDNRCHGGRFIGQKLFAQAGLAPDDVDVAMVFDHFTMAVPLTLEQYGFCELGEGGPFIESGETAWPHGSLPVNTHGGSNGEAFIHGVNHVSEAVRQLRGSAVNQVTDAEVAFVNGSITDPAGALLLRR